jgi:hypothetical protein
MLKLQTVVQLKKPDQEKKVIPRWKYKRHSFPNGKKSYWIKWKLYPDDAKFFANGRSMIIDFNKELNLDNINIDCINEWKIGRSSYYQHLPFMVEEFNFFETLYDKDGELIAALFRIKYLMDVNSTEFTDENIKTFKDLCYKTLMTPSMKEKIKLMIDENYVDDIEENTEQTSPDILTIMQRKKKSLEFKNEHVKAMLMISFGIKILSVIISHFFVTRGLVLAENQHLFYDFYKDMFKEFDFDFSIYNKIYSYIENKVNSSYNFNKSIYEQQEIEGLNNKK